jgi:hypothetical protein
MFVCPPHSFFTERPPHSCVAWAINSSVVSGMVTSDYFILETSARIQMFYEQHISTLES